MNKKLLSIILMAVLFAPVSVEAKKKEKKAEVPQLQNYPSAELSEYRLHGGNVVVQGHIVVSEEVKSEKMPQELLNQLNGRFTVIMRNYIVRKEKTSVIEFKDDGTFSMNIYVPYPMQVLIYPMGTAYACPGDTINVTIDPTKRTKEEGIKFDGTGLGGEVTRLWQQIDDKYCKFDNSDNVYERGLDSLAMWKDEPNNIRGEHIHITRAEWGYLQEKFQFTAIPFVVILDKNGKQRKDVTVEQLLNE